MTTRKVDIRLSDYIDLLPKQAQFMHHILSGEVPFVAYVGGYGSGKTRIGCHLALELSLRYPGNLGVIFRKTYSELRDTTQKSFFQDVFVDELKELLELNWKQGDKELTIRTADPNRPSEILFRHLDESDKGLEKIKSYNLGWFYIDEASEFDEEVYLMLMGRLRRQNIPIHCGFITTNPAGHNWIYRRFKKSPQPDHALVHAPTAENKHLPKGYMDRLLANYSDDQKRRYLDADFNVFEGQIYPEFSPRDHVMMPFRIEGDMNLIGAIDPHTRQPSAVLFSAVDRDGVVFHWDYIYERLTADDMAAAIHARLRGRPCRWVIDTSANERDTTSGYSLADALRENGIITQSANKRINPGIQRVKRFLKLDPYLKKPMVYWFNTLEVPINQFITYCWEEGPDGKEQPKKVNDHFCDCVRYLLNSNLVMYQDIDNREFYPAGSIGHTTWREKMKARKHTGRRSLIEAAS